MKGKLRIIIKIILLVLIFPTGLQAKNNASVDLADKSIFARIDDIVISQQEFNDLFAAAVRQKFYHGKVPDKKLIEFRKQVAEDIVIQVLLHREAVRQGIKPDSEKIKQGISEYDNKYQNSPDWQMRREQVIPLMIRRMERKDLIESLEFRVKSIPEPDLASVIQYYNKNLQKFTEPKRLGLSVIILNVPPSSSDQTWLDAEKAAEQFSFRITNGESFEDIAGQYSSHASAINGGDLGYLHQGMLEDEIQKAVEQLDIDQITSPLKVLEGIALFRLNGIHPEKKHSFDEVKQRASGLLHRQMKEQAWDSYVEKLKYSAAIYINKSLYVLNSHE